jgi:hypothetical protein
MKKATVRGKRVRTRKVLGNGSPRHGEVQGSSVKAVRSHAGGAEKAKATTLRLDPQVQKGLEIIQKVDKRPINKLVNEAVRMYVVTRVPRIATDLESLLASVKGYRLRDPDFDVAIDKFVDAEVKLGGADPAEGTVIERGAGEDEPRRSAAQTMVRRILGR